VKIAQNIFPEGSASIVTPSPFQKKTIFEKSISYSISERRIPREKQSRKTPTAAKHLNHCID
jgi:hypothetical protein